VSRPDGAPFAEILHTRRFDGGAVGSWKLSQEISLRSRLSITATDLDRTFGSQRIPSNQNTIFTEHALNGDTREHQWAVGVAFQHSALRVPAVPGVGYTYNVPGIFAQDEFSPLQWLIHNPLAAQTVAAQKIELINAPGPHREPKS
jgi:iron complex outermembrane receptor protein